jgi:hypothetical protein
MLMIEISARLYETHLNWDDAMMYCQLLVIDGVDDWRMPTIEELNEIYNSENTFSGSYWSSTEYEGNYAWCKSMLDGFYYGDRKGYSYYVRAVRSI